MTETPRAPEVPEEVLQEAIRDALSDCSTVDFYDISSDGIGNMAMLAAKAVISLRAAPPEPTVEQLRACGYAPGGYMATCQDCGEKPWDLDKRATRCKPCATAAFARTIAAAPAAPPADGGTDGLREAMTECQMEAPIYEAFARYVGDADERASDFRMFATGYHAAEQRPNAGASKVDPQVWTAARNLTAEQAKHPEWIWWDDLTISFGRWAANGHQAPYVRADIAISSRTPAGAAGDLAKRMSQLCGPAAYHRINGATRPASLAPAASAEIARWLQDRIVAAEQARDAYPDNSEKGAVLDGAIGALASVITFVRSAPDAAPAPAAQVNPGREEIATILRRELIARHDYDSTMRPCSWIDGIDEAADAILAARPGAEGDADFVLVPEEPTDEMLWAGGTALHDQGEDSAGIYRAMLAARPDPSPAKGGN